MKKYMRIANMLGITSTFIAYVRDYYCVSDDEAVEDVIDILPDPRPTYEHYDYYVGLRCVGDDLLMSLIQAYQDKYESMLPADVDVEALAGAAAICATMVPGVSASAESMYPYMAVAACLMVHLDSVYFDTPEYRTFMSATMSDDRSLYVLDYIVCIGLRIYIGHSLAIIRVVRDIVDVVQEDDPVLHDIIRVIFQLMTVR